MRLWDALMIGAIAGGALLLATTKDSFGGDRLVVPLPDVSALGRTEAESLIRQLAEVNVITSHCPDWPISDGEWTLLTGTGDLLAQRLGLDPGAYERDYFGPAFGLLDDPAACGRIGPRARPLIDRLTGMGGGTRPLRD
ncbi:hypothetical protein [Paracoccus spongiarum]|uniref:Uncharacterized protein n=1 Tax=Paracoccus spongiarum TaxID=3064387 RepID=A0ABT9J9W1_9RHOB|nr:hypothetical protein [Paracoccus sp. 2205BS29-5]MDP5306603.1 hypothetical protein [Paracoccus sp. 2205BS29-5]